MTVRICRLELFLTMSVASLSFACLSLTYLLFWKSNREYYHRGNECRSDLKLNAYSTLTLKVLLI